VFPVFFERRKGKGAAEKKKEGAMQRIVFEFLQNPQEAAEEWSALQQALEQLGARLVHPPEGSPPYPLLAVVEKEEDVPMLLSRLRELKCVGRAQRDAWRRAF
jgi:hypothetical protein